MFTEISREATVTFLCVKIDCFSNGASGFFPFRYVFNNMNRIQFSLSSKDDGLDVSLDQHMLQCATNLARDVMHESGKYNGTDKSSLLDLVTRYAQEHPSWMLRLRFDIWGMGNLLHYLVAIYMFPICFGKPPFTEQQRRELLYVIYKLINVCGTPLDEQDQYGTTPLQVIDRYVRFTKTNTNIEAVEELRHLLQNAHTLRCRQVFLIKRFLLHKRRKKAAGIICNRVLEYVLNPYTPVGYRLLQKRAERFYKTYCF